MTILPQLRESPDTANDQAAAGLPGAAGCRAQPLVDNRHNESVPTSKWIGLE
jgi:hypothetical protein